MGRIIPHIILWKIKHVPNHQPELVVQPHLGFKSVVPQKLAMIDGHVRKSQCWVTLLRHALRHKQANNSLSIAIPKLRDANMWWNALLQCRADTFLPCDNSQVHSVGCNCKAIRQKEGASHFTVAVLIVENVNALTAGGNRYGVVHRVYSW